MTDNINGTILRIDYEEEIILCELYTSPKHRCVNLPFKCFPIDEVVLGRPINLAVDSDHNIKITIRERLEKTENEIMWETFRF